MELAPPAAGDSMSFQELLTVVHTVETAHDGRADLSVEAVSPPQDDAMTIALRVELEVTSGKPQPSAVFALGLGVEPISTRPGR